MKLTKAQIKALIAVRDGKVTHRFDAKGNAYEGPRGIGPVYRKLADVGLIEDVSGQKGGGAYASHFKQRLTAAGRAALNIHQGKS